MARQFNTQTKRGLLNEQRIHELSLGFGDTLIACSLQRDTVNYWHEMQWTRRYLAGEYPPHYPVPAVISTNE